MSQHFTYVQRHMTALTRMAFILLVFGMIIVMLSIYLPPKGEIHPSVITVFGMVLVAVGAFFGLDLNKSIRDILKIPPTELTSEVSHHSSHTQSSEDEVERDCKE